MCNWFNMADIFFSFLIMHSKFIKFFVWAELLGILILMQKNLPFKLFIYGLSYSSKQVLFMGQYLEPIKQRAFYLLYKKEQLLGEGSYSKVYCGEDLREKKPVALKFLKKNDIIVKELKREIGLLKDAAKLKDERLLKFHGAYKVLNNEKVIDIVIVTDICDFSLRELIEKKKYSLLPALQICRQISFGLKSFQKIGCVHRDLKPQNILIMKRQGGFLPVIADFGHARELEIFMTDLKGTLIYADPYLFGKCQNYNFNWDIFSLGLIFAEVICRYYIIPLGEANTVQKIHRKMAKFLSDIKGNLKKIEEIPQSCHSLIEGCLRRQNRFQINEVITQLNNLIISEYDKKGSNPQKRNELQQIAKTHIKKIKQEDNYFQQQLSVHQTKFRGLDKIDQYKDCCLIMKKQLKYLGMLYYISKMNQIKVRNNQQLKKYKAYIKKLIKMAEPLNIQMIKPQNLSTFTPEVRLMIQTKNFCNFSYIKESYHNILFYSNLDPYSQNQLCCLLD